MLRMTSKRVKEVVDKLCLPAVVRLRRSFWDDARDVSSLETQTLERENEGNCPVCQCEWELGDEVRVLPCGHQFHTHCIDHWLTKHQASCPLCKKDVREEWEDVEGEHEEEAASESLGGYAFQDEEFAHDFSEKMREKQIQTWERYAGIKRTRSDYEQVV